MSRSRNLGYGEGSIYQEGDGGRWRGELRIGARRRRVSAWTRREVVQKLDKLRSLNAAGLMMGKDIRVGEWFDWYDEVVISTKNKNNAASYRWALKHCEPLRGHRLSELEVEHVEDLFRELAREKPNLTKTKGEGAGTARDSASRRSFESRWSSGPRSTRPSDETRCGAMLLVWLTYPLPRSESGCGGLSRPSKLANFWPPSRARPTRPSFLSH